MGILDGRTVLVTGVGAGLGTQVAAAVLREGGQAVIGARNAERLSAIATELDPTGRRIAHQACDITDDDQCAAIVELARSRFGGLDGLAQVAALDSIADTLARGAIENWARAAETNVGGTMRIVRAAAPLLARSSACAAEDQASVVIVGSVAAAGPSAEVVQTAYGVSKAAQEALGHYLSKELGPKRIRVNVVAPGYKLGPVLEAGFRHWAAAAGVGVEQVADPIKARLALGDFATDADCANTIAFFLSTRSRGVTGQTVYVDSGQVLH